MSPAGRQDGRIPAWPGGGRGGSKQSHCRSRRSRPPGCESAVPAVEDRECESSSLGLQSLKVLIQCLQLDERRQREPFFPCQAFPKSRRSATALGQTSAAARMGEFALEEGLL